MVQKLLILQRESKEELQKAIEKNILNKEMRLITFSVLEGVNDESPLDHAYTKRPVFEAWCIVEVPHTTAKFYDKVMMAV